MLEGNIASLLRSLLGKVFEESCLTKDNVQSDIYNGIFHCWFIILRTYQIFKPRGQKVASGQSFCTYRISPWRDWIIGGQALCILHFLEWATEDYCSCSSSFFIPRQTIFVWSWSQLMIIQSMTPFKTTMYFFDISFILECKAIGNHCCWSSTPASENVDGERRGWWGW